MSDIVKMSVEPRPGVGKGAARAARRAGFVPGVIYGDKKDPVTIQIKSNELLKTLNKGGFYTTIFDIEVDGGNHRVIPKDIQKNKLNGLPEHVDFMRLTKGAKIVVNVPLHFLNEDECPGLKAGGALNVARHEIEVQVDPANIPEAIEVDLKTFEIGDTIHFSDAIALEGVEPTITDRDFTLATIIEPRAAVEEDEEEVTETEVIEQNAETVQGEDEQEPS